MSYGFNPDNLTLGTILFSIIYGFMLFSILYVLRIFSRNVAKKLMFNLYPSLILLIGLPMVNNSINMWIKNKILVVPEEFAYYSLGFQCLIIIPVCLYCLLKLNSAIEKNAEY